MTAVERYILSRQLRDKTIVDGDLSLFSVHNPV